MRLREQRGAAIRVRGAERVWRQALARAWASGVAPYSRRTRRGTRSRPVASFGGGVDASGASGCKGTRPNKQAPAAAVHAP